MGTLQSIKQDLTDLTPAEVIYKKWYSNTILVRSYAFNKGVLSALRRYVNGESSRDLNPQFRVGSANYDAFHSGFIKGYQLARRAKQ